MESGLRKTSNQRKTKQETKGINAPKISKNQNKTSVEHDEFGFRVLTNKELDKLIPPFD